MRFTKQYYIYLLMVLYVFCPIYNEIQAKDTLELITKKKFKKAYKDYENDSELYPDDIYYKKGKDIAELLVKGDINLDKALLFLKGIKYYFKDHDPDNALKSINNSILKEKVFFDDYFYKGHILFNENEFKNAFDCFNKCIELNPDSAESYYYRGFCYEKDEQYKTALADYKTTLEKGLTNSSIYIRKILMHKNLDEFQDAIKDCTTAFKLILNESKGLEVQAEEYKDTVSKATQQGNWVFRSKKWIKFHNEENKRKYFKIKERNMILNNYIGNIYYNEGDKKLGIFFIEKSLKEAELIILEYTKFRAIYSPDEIITNKDIIISNAGIVLDYYKNSDNINKINKYENYIINIAEYIDGLKEIYISE